DGDGHQGTEYYQQHREAMDEGSAVAWPERFNADELSAIQHSMNLRFRNEGAFMAEYQNTPKPPAIAGEIVLTAAEIAKKVNGRQRGEVPSAVECLTAFVDVHDDLLFYAVSGWEKDFTGFGIEYGAFPEQSKRYFTLSSAQPTLQQKFSGGAKESAIFAGLEVFAAELLARHWTRDDGTTLQIGRLLIDSGYLPEIVASVIRKLNQTVIAMPSKGIGISAANKPMSEYERKPGDVQGHYWRIPATTGRELRIVNIDTNFWKTLLQGRLAIPLGDRGTYTLHGNERTDHQLVADHLSSEYRIETAGRGRTVWEWKKTPGAGDNHLLDCFVGTAVGASMLGIALPGSAAPPTKRNRRPIGEMIGRLNPT
ncbi:MAG: terminase gpA endonuclease subunit, partial [Planctomycetota bacterium]